MNKEMVDEMTRRVKFFITWITGLAMLGVYPAAWAESGLMFPEERWHVALDAGHGGDDVGARGPTGLLEKAVCLELARSLALRLEDGFRVTLTRSDDYRVQMRQRAAIANQAKANIFISLHTGASFQHAARGTTIYYHAPGTPLAERSVQTSAATDQPLPWHQVQARHRPGSQALAQALEAELAKHLEDRQITVTGAPLAPLEGADMPAVLIELGNITHPAMEQRLATPQGVESLAQAIEQGINAYIQGKGSVPQQ